MARKLKYGSMILLLLLWQQWHNKFVALVYARRGLRFARSRLFGSELSEGGQQKQHGDPLGQHF